jgi:hypothetical protein
MSIAAAVTASCCMTAFSEIARLPIISLTTPTSCFRREMRL